MKKLILIISTIVFTSCSTGTYHEYEVINHTSKRIIVEVTTYGGEYQKFLSYEINPNDWENIFEHPNHPGMIQNKDNFLKYIKSIEIYDASNHNKMVKKFTSNNMKNTNKDGLFGHYIMHKFIVTDNDFE